MTKLNLFLSSQTGLCLLILHPLLFEMVTLTFYLLLMQEILGSRSHPTQPRTSMSQTSADPLTLNCGRVSSIRHLLTVTATKTLLSAFVPSKLDYCNSLLSCSPQFILDKLQRVQNSAASSVMKPRKCDHVQPLLRSLHWLPVHSRIDYKISTLCFNTFTNSSPVYTV